MPILPFLLLMVLVVMAAVMGLAIHCYDWQRYELVKRRSFIERAFPFILFFCASSLALLLALAFSLTVPK